MIEASFEGMTERSAAVSGAYQYDTGQRLRLYGLPSPEELAERDDFLSGDVVTVQAQYAYVGDSQTEMRLAAYDEETGAWTAAVPDAYMTRSADVHVYIYVGYGQTEESMRAKTCYEAVFRPMGRPAPGTEVTPDQINAWDALAQEVNLAIAGVNAAASDANAAATEAREMTGKLDGTTAEAVTLAAGSEATAKVIDKAGRKHIVIGVPAGADGADGKPGVFSINGKEVPAGGQMTIGPDDIGAMPADRVFVYRFTAALPADGWSEEAPYTQTVSIEGILETDEPVADIDMSGATAETEEALMEAWAMISRIETAEDAVTAVCLTDRPPSDMVIRLMVIE